MRFQAVVGSAKIVERVRVMGSLKAAMGAELESDLACKLSMPQFTSAELLEAVEQLVFTGKLRRFDWFEAIGNTGCCKSVTIFTVA
jgi:hypothetical protein